VASYERALALRSDSFAAHSNLGSALREQGKLADAVTSYQRALALRPDCAEVHGNLGHLLCDQGKFADAAESYERAIVLKPDLAEANRNLGNALTGRARSPRQWRAISERSPSTRTVPIAIWATRSGTGAGSARRWRATSGRSPASRINLGIKLSRLAEAVENYQRALTSKRSSPKPIIWAWRSVTRAASPRPWRATSGR
jgi:tetratricopeptide (TPR) repeat protein